MEFDVLVVGAGPTGLMCANQLARHGIRVKIIDRHAGPALQTRALGVQARTLEIYSKLGIVERALKLGKPSTGAVLWAQGRKMARVPLAATGQQTTPYPYILMLGQDDNERIMGDNLQKLGVAVQWNTELIGLAQEPGVITATLKPVDGAAQNIQVPWVAGCDGARSAVRKLSNITFPGAPYEHVFFVADVEMTGRMVPDEVNVYLWRSGFHLLFPMRGGDHWRIVGILPSDMRDKSNIDFEMVIPSLRSEAGAELSFKKCSWFSTYRISHRCASRFRDRRCFLLGDAAHIHSPVGAQGMNTGLQDAYNLSWKLALVIKGQARDQLLDTYEEERIPVALRLLNTTDRAFNMIVSVNWFAGLFRTQILARFAAFALGLKPIQRFAFHTVSQIGIRYRRSPLSKTMDGLPASAPRAGDRFPWLKLKLKPDGSVEDLFQLLDDKRFNLILIDQPSATSGTLGLDHLINTYEISSEFENGAELASQNIPHPSFYLLRPDGHIGLCGPLWEPASVKSYISQLSPRAQDS